jgi:hypothetical protein
MVFRGSSRPWLGPKLALTLALALSIGALPACKKRSTETGEEAAASAEPSTDPSAAPAAAESGDGTIVEEGDLGTITWRVTDDGRVEAVVKRPDGTQVTKEVSGDVTWPGEGDDGKGSKIALTLEEDGRLVAKGPALESDLTQIDYALVIEGKPWNGVLHVPKGGTRVVDEDARASAAVEVPEGKRGPNGGVIQIIGGEPVEVVADSTTGEMRVYVLGPDFRVIDPGERHIRLGYMADTSETVEMVREPGGMYFVAGVRTRVNPVRVTLAVGFRSQVHVGIVGFRAGMRLGVGVRARAVPIMVERRWAPSVAVRGGVGVRVGERVRVRERVEVRHHDRGLHRGWDHDRGHAYGHGKVHVKEHHHGGFGGPSHHGGHGPSKHGGGHRGKRR